MNSNEILFIGIGQAGNNLVSEVIKTNKRINGIFINTNKDDLKNIENAKHTFIVPSASGTGRNRSKAKEYIKDQIMAITDLLNEFPMHKHIYFSFSMGGGTGSGMTPTLLSVLSKLKPNLKVNLVPILPFDNESKKTQENTLECWNELVSLQNINSIYLLDNNKRKTKGSINKEFADLFKLFLNTTDSHKDGVIDGAEIETLATAKGLAGIYKLDNYIENNENSIAKEILSSIFVVGNSNCKYLGLSIPPRCDYQPFLDIYNIEKDYFVGYTDNDPLLMVSGAPLSSKSVSHVKDILDIKNSSLKRSGIDYEDNDPLTIDIDLKEDLEKSNNDLCDEKSIDDLMEDEDSFWDSVLNM